jgi:hypothetical protein
MAAYWIEILYSAALFTLYLRPSDRLKREQTEAEQAHFEAMKIARDVLSNVTERDEYIRASSHDAFVAGQRRHIAAKEEQEKVDETAAVQAEAARREESNRVSRLQVLSSRRSIHFLLTSVPHTNTSNGSTNFGTEAGQVETGLRTRCS